MSRHIQAVNPESRKLNNHSETGKLILTTLNNRTFAFLLQNDTLIWAQVCDYKQADRIGQIYIGKVKNVVPNMDACFVEIADREVCYLSMKDAKYAYLLNRPGKAAYNTDTEQIRLVQGDELPVQIIRGAIKTKPAAVSCALELQSDYFVCKADKASLGISGKIDKDKSRRIRRILEEAGAPSTFCVIARTKCQELDETSILEEYGKLQNAFCNLYEKAAHRTCFSCIHAEGSPVKSILRQVPAYEYEEIITDISDVFQELQKDPAVTKTVRFYEDRTFSLSSLYGLQSRFDNACSKKVWLKSGANLIIEQTECLTAIDVNSSKNIKGKISEDMIFSINMEAAGEAALQIRLRNLSGIIIIDFINMKEKEHEKALLTYLSELTAKDPVSTKVVDMTPLGLVEITRKKIHMSLKEQLIHEIY